MEKHVIGKGGRVCLLIAVGLRLAAFGCGQPESFKAGAARLTGVGGSGAGLGGVMGAAGDVGAAGRSAPTGAAGANVLTGTAGSGQAGSTSGAAGEAGGAGQGGGAGSATTSGGAGTGMDGGAGKGNGSTGGGAGAPDGGAKAPDGGEGGTGAGGTSGGGTGGNAGGMAGGAGGVTGAAGTTAVNYCDRARWTAKASVSVGDGGGPAAGIDGDLTTRWATNRSQDGTDYYLVSFGGTIKLSGITLNNTQTYPDDYPGAYAVYGSTDGTTFDATAFVTGSGTVNSTVITFAPRAVRAVRVAQTGTSRSTNWWQIGEFQVTCAAP